MRILQVHNEYTQRGGEDSVVAADANQLRALGHDVQLFSTQNPSQPAQAAIALTTAPWNFASARRFKRKLTEWRPDVVHIHNTWFSLTPSVVAAAHASGVPVVMTLHNYRLRCSNGLLFRAGSPCTDCIGNSALHGIAHRCYRNSLGQSTVAAVSIGVHKTLCTWERNVDRFITFTEFSRAVFLEGGLPQEKLTVRPGFVEDSGHRASPPSTSRTVLFVGRLSAEKGVAQLLSAWRQANCEGLVLRIIGDGPERKALERDAPESVQFVGRRSPADVQTEMKAARALVFPSQWFEGGMPMVLLEAMAASLPVLGSRLGVVPETIGEDAAGQTLNVGDWVDGFRLLLDDQWIDTKSKGARALYEQRYSPATGIQSLMNIYKSLVP